MNWFVFKIDTPLFCFDVLYDSLDSSCIGSFHDITNIDRVRLAWTK